VELPGRPEQLHDDPQHRDTVITETSIQSHRSYRKAPLDLKEIYREGSPLPPAQAFPMLADVTAELHTKSTSIDLPEFESDLIAFAAEASVDEPHLALASLFVFMAAGVLTLSI